MADIDLDAIERDARHCAAHGFFFDGSETFTPTEVLALVRAVRAALALEKGDRRDPTKTTLWNVRCDRLAEFDLSMEPFRKEAADG